MENYNTFEMLMAYFNVSFAEIASFWATLSNDDKIDFRLAPLS